MPLARVYLLENVPEAFLYCFCEGLSIPKGCRDGKSCKGVGVVVLVFLFFAVFLFDGESVGSLTLISLSERLTRARVPAFELSWATTRIDMRYRV